MDGRPFATLPWPLANARSVARSAVRVFRDVAGFMPSPIDAIWSYAPELSFSAAAAICRASGDRFGSFTTPRRHASATRVEASGDGGTPVFGTALGAAADDPACFKVAGSSPRPIAAIW